MYVHKGMGLVSQVFTENDIDMLRGESAGGRVLGACAGCCALPPTSVPLTLPTPPTTPRAAAAAAGSIAIGHTRYSTAGGSKLVAAQPFVLETDLGQLAIAHNGQVARAAELRKLVLNRGVGLFTNSDSEVIAQVRASAAVAAVVAGSCCGWPVAHPPPPSTRSPRRRCSRARTTWRWRRRC